MDPSTSGVSTSAAAHPFDVDPEETREWLEALAGVVRKASLFALTPRGIFRAAGCKRAPALYASPIRSSALGGPAR